MSKEYHLIPCFEEIFFSKSCCLTISHILSNLHLQRMLYRNCEVVSADSCMVYVTTSST